MTLPRRLARVWLAAPGYLQRQSLFTVLFVIIVIGIPLTRFRPPSWPTLISAIVVVLGTTLLTVILPWRAWPPEWRLAIPLTGIVAIGLLRAATGEDSSPYGYLIILPALAAGVEVRRRRSLLLVALVAVVHVFVPYLVLAHPAALSIAVFLRAVFTPLVAVLAALVVYELSRTVRANTATLRALQQEQDTLLRRTQRDAEELAETGRALRGARDAFGSVIDAVTEQSIIATDQDGLITIFNPGAERLLGARRADVVRRRNVTDFHLRAELAAPDEHGRSGFAALVGEAAQGHAEVHDRTYVTEAGREIIVQQAVTPRYDSRNSVIGFLFVATDMTEAREVARLKDEFVSLISHELRTPLSSILGYLELVLDDDEDPLNPEQTQYLTIVERNAHRLLRLVGDLLFAAQVEAGKFAIEEQEVDLVAVVAAASETALPSAAAAGVGVETQLPAGPVVVSGDPMRLGQACDNLLSNAIKFTPRDGEVCISLGCQADSAVIEVRDTGFGIAAAEVEGLFVRFFRASTATQHAIPGVGLGLSITRAIALAHHGELDVHSVEGSGTTFSLRLPLREE